MRVKNLLLLLAALPAIAAEGPTRAGCTFDPLTFRDAKHIRAEVAELAERVAPAATSGRRRSVTPGPGNFPADRNFIDREIFAKMRASGVYPSPLGSDSEFLRRVTIDLIGRIPKSDELIAFADDTAPGKRDRAIERLLASDDFNDRWTLWFGDLVQNVQSAADVGQGVFRGRTPYFLWIRNSIAARKPYDVMVRELLTSKGEQLTSPAANYFVRLFQENGPPQDTFDNVATQSGAQFLALPMNCVSCHDGRQHLESLNFGMSLVTRRQLWGMAAFFAGIRVEHVQSGNTGSFVVSEAAAAEYTLTTTDGNKSPRQPREGESEIVAPRYLNGEGPVPGEDRRAAFARLLTADRQFARAAVNYVWKELFGLGIVEPANSFDLSRLHTSQATHPALLEALTDDFVASGFDLRALIRRIAQSSAYQLSGRHPAWREWYTPYFARHYPRRMMAEVLVDSIHVATGRSMQASDPLHGPITKAVAAPDPVTLLWNGRPEGRFLADFGQGDRDSIARSAEPSLIQNLSLMNDVPLVLNGLKNGSRVFSLRNAPPETIVNELWLATLSRRPSEAELQIALAHLAGGPILERAQDLQFALLNKLEFLFY